MAKDAAPAPDAGAAPKKKKTLLIILIAVFALLLVGGGVVGYLLMTPPAKEKQAKADAEEHGDEHGEEEEGEEHAEDDGHGPIYEKLETFTVNLADGETFLQVEISLKVADAKVQDKLKKHMPEVRDAMLRLLSSKAPEELADVAGKDRLAGEIQTQMNKVIGVKKASKGVKGVLFTAFILQ